jgi:hypothetical protein
MRMRVALDGIARGISQSRERAASRRASAIKKSQCWVKCANRRDGGTSFR